VIGLDQSATGT